MWRNQNTLYAREVRSKQAADPLGAPDADLSTQLRRAKAELAKKCAHVVFRISCRILNKEKRFSAFFVV